MGYIRYLHALAHDILEFDSKSDLIFLISVHEKNSNIHNYYIESTVII